MSDGETEVEYEVHPYIVFAQKWDVASDVRDARNQGRKRIERACVHDETPGGTSIDDLDRVVRVLQTKCGECGIVKARTWNYMLPDENPRMLNFVIDWSEPRVVENKKRIEEKKLDCSLQ